MSTSQPVIYQLKVVLQGGWRWQLVASVAQQQEVVNENPRLPTECDIVSSD
jgi:hypothetical protein